MSLRLHSIIDILKQIAFIVVIYAIVIQPAVQTFSFFSQYHYELMDLEGDEDTNKEEKQEDDSRDEKIDFDNVNTNYNQYPYNQGSSSYINPKLLWNFNQEIPIPPPERV